MGPDQEWSNASISSIPILSRANQLYSQNLSGNTLFLFIIYKMLVGP